MTSLVSWERPAFGSSAKSGLTMLATSLQMPFTSCAYVEWCHWNDFYDLGMAPHESTVSQLTSIWSTWSSEGCSCTWTAFSISSACFGSFFELAKLVLECMVKQNITFLILRYILQSAQSWAQNGTIPKTLFLLLDSIWSWVDLTHDWQWGLFLPTTLSFFWDISQSNVRIITKFPVFSKTSILDVLTKGKLAIFDTPAINEVRVMSCFSGFRQK